MRRQASAIAKSSDQSPGTRWLALCRRGTEGLPHCGRLLRLSLFQVLPSAWRWVLLPAHAHPGVMIVELSVPASVVALNMVALPILFAPAARADRAPLR